MKKETPLFYVFELNPPGYLIVTGSYDLPPVIAYSFTSNFQTILKAILFSICCMLI